MAEPETAANTSISAVVCAYDLARWELARRAVESLRGQTPAVDQILLVIDHNRELLASARRSLTDVEVIPNEGPRGASTARNTALRRATGTLVAFLDDDAVAAPGWSAGIRAAFADRAVAGIGGPVAPEWHAGRPAWFPPEFDWVVGCTHPGMPHDWAEIRNPVGANMAFRTELLVAAGGFRADLGRVGRDVAGCEETELAIRLRASAPGSTVMFAPDVRVRHHVHASRATWGYFVRRCFGEGRSKADMGRMTARGALGTEVRYTLRTLPVGMARAVVSAVRGRRPARMLRVPAIALGLGATTGGFIWQRALMVPARSRASR